MEKVKASWIIHFFADFQHGTAARVKPNGRDHLRPQDDLHRLRAYFRNPNKVRGCQRVYGAQNLASLVQRQVPGLGTQSIHDGLLQVLTRKTSWQLLKLGRTNIDQLTLWDLPETFSWPSLKGLRSYDRSLKHEIGWLEVAQIGIWMST